MPLLHITLQPPLPSHHIRTTECTPPTTPFGPLVGLTLLGRADEVPDTTNTAIVLALRFIQLHAHPLAAGELGGPAEPQCACLEEQGRVWRGEALGGHDRPLFHRQRGGGSEGVPDSNLSSDITIYWLYDITSLCLNVLFCKIGAETVPTLEDCYRTTLFNTINSH